MKKRSLFAAVAMLIVSAIVLTSATYAWFASSAKATMETISATIQNSNGGIYLSTDNEHWKSELTTSDFSGLPSQLTPVSGLVNKTTGEISFVGGNLAGQAFTSSAASSSAYIHYQVYVLAQVAGTLSVPTSISFGNQNFGRAFLVAHKGDDKIGTVLFLGGAADTYRPVIVEDQTATDSNADGIIDTTEKAAILGDPTPAAATPAGQEVLTNYSMSANDVIVIDVWQWAEGQHAKCTGNVDLSTFSSKLIFNFSGDPADTTVAGG